MPRRGSRVRSPSRALANKKGYPLGYPFFIIEKCEALLERMLPCSKGSISRVAKAPLGRAKAKVHRTLWHPARSFLDNKKNLRVGSPFLLSRSARHFSNACCLAARVRFLGSLKRPSVVPVPRSTGPCGTRLTLLSKRAATLI